MRRTWRALAVVVAAAVVSGCGVPGLAPRERLPAEPVSALACADPLGSAEGMPPAGTIPDDFEATAVYRCDAFASEESEGNLWSGTSVARLEGDLAPFLAAIAAPSDPPWQGPCTADMVIAPELWAGDDAGRFVRLSYPVTGCGKPKSADVEAALAQLDVVEETFQRAALAESAEARTAGCPTRAGAPLVLLDGLTTEEIVTAPVDVGGVQPEPTPGMTGVPWTPPALPDPATVDGLRACFYEPSADASAMAVYGAEALFASARELSAAEGRAFLAAVAAAESAPECGDTATRFVVVHPHDPSARPADPGVIAATAAVTVELDGCRRLVDPGFRALATPPDILALLQP